MGNWNKKLTNAECYYKLLLFQKKYPELTFNNQGYQYLKPKIKEVYKKQIEEISDILRKSIKGFSRFDNFKPRENGTFAIRCQYYWDASFCGVGYFNINEFKDLHYA